MKFATIEPQLRRAQIGDYADLHAAERAVGLEPTKVDHGVVSRTRRRGLSIVVFEFGMFVPPPQQFYFAIGSHLYAGNAVLYAFAPAGETIDIDEPLPPLDWFADASAVERAILRGAVMRPQLKVNGEVMWSWPEPRPRDVRVAL